MSRISDRHSDAAYSYGARMARPWRAGGDGRSVLIPELPWKRKKETPVFEPEFHTSVAGEYPHRKLHYWSCPCGQNGTLHDDPAECALEATRHTEWHLKND